MLYKYLFSILCGHLNLNQKRKKFEFDLLPVQPTGKPVKPTGKPFGTGWTCNFEFDRFPPVSGQTGPVNRYRTAPVWPDRSVYLTLLLTTHTAAAIRCDWLSAYKRIGTLDNGSLRETYEGRIHMHLRKETMNDPHTSKICVSQAKFNRCFCTPQARPDPSAHGGNQTPLIHAIMKMDIL